MRLAAKVLFPGTGWVAFKELMDLVGLMMDLFGKRFLPRLKQTEKPFSSQGFGILTIVRTNLG